MLRAFTIGGFRNFPNPPEWVGPLARVNIFVGANNCGKSNVLRYIQRVLVPTLAKSGKTKVLTGIDRNGDDPGPPWIQVEIPFDPGGPQEGFRRQLQTHQIVEGLKPFLSESQDGLIASIAFPKSDQGTFPIAQMPASPEHSSPALRDFWSAITGQSGGGYEHWYAPVANWVASRALGDRSCHYIQTFRALSTRLSEFETEYTKASGGNHLIDDLAEIERPAWNDQDKKEDFKKLVHFLQTLLENDGARAEVSADRTHIMVHMNGRATPLEALGSGLHEVFMLAAAIILRADDIVLLEEPETHLHPGLQRKLMMFLMENASSQLFITTHSSVIIDTPGANIFGVASDPEGRASIAPLLTNQERYVACRNLGYRASDLLQSNCVIWVEGPSDRLYLSNWLKHVDCFLVEGVHYSIMFYGGRLLSHLSATDGANAELIELLPINRRCSILIDSDKGAPNQSIRPTKQRIIDEVKSIGGLSWLTDGREIENYYTAQDRDEAIRAVHKGVARTNVNGNRYSRPLSYWKQSEAEERVANKITTAEWLTAHKQPAWNSLGLRESLEQLAQFVRDSNA